MKKIKICTPVIGKNLKEFLENLEKIQQVSNFIELRVDKIKNLTEKDLRLIRKKTKKEAILTCREKEILFKACRLGFQFIDIDLETLEKEKINLPKNLKTKFIVSFHDFKKTPSAEFLRKLVLRMDKHKPNIIKIATMVRKEIDNIKLFKLILDKKLKKDRIIIGMGRKGKMTRLLGPILGTYLTYAMVDEMKSAAGQLQVGKLKKFYE